MPRVLLLASLGAAFIVLGGCAAQDTKDARDFQVRRLERERDTYADRASTEAARCAALEQRTQATEEELNTVRAQAAALRDHVEKLTTHTRELETLVSEQQTRELQRPRVPASPLPPAVDEALQQFAARFADRVWYDRGRGAISFANDRLFDLGSDNVRADAHAGLDELAQVLGARELEGFEVIVVGHTDVAPITKPETLAKHPTNWHLSVHRAIAVKDVLVSAGVPLARVGIMGYADQRPAGDDPARNRRVEVFIVRKGGVQPFEPVQPTRRRA
jgi:chemotaxis protein MotB